ncbi:MAG: transposase [Cyanobacteria bacterium J06627_15]
MRSFKVKRGRRSIRLKGYDYASSDVYFVTICAYERRCIFGDIWNRRTVTNVLGEIATDCWREIPAHFPHIRTDEFVVMPNHVHGLLVLDDKLWQNSEKPEYIAEFGKAVPGSIPTVIRTYKAAVTRQIREIQACRVRVWQRGYHERIVRNDNALHRVRRYILNNPMMWNRDRLNGTNGDNP